MIRSPSDNPQTAARRVELDLAPLDVVRAWPKTMPVAAMVSGPDGGTRGRWSIIARPWSWALVDGRGEIVPRPSGLHAAAADADAPAFVGGWLGFLSYDLGSELEPSAGKREDAPWPAGGWARCESAYVHDNSTGAWWVVGDTDVLPRVEELRERAAGRACAASGGDAAHGEHRAGFAFDGPLRSLMGRERYERAVASAVEYIRAGDVFQVNLAHVLAGRLRGSPRALFGELARSARPWYGSYLETPWGVIASLSPELFLDYDASGGARRVMTRPMKGTRGGEHTAAELMASEKDAAELNMIVDLMRNDLGRVCEYGTVRVDSPREVEAHGAAGGGEIGTARGTAAEMREVGGWRGVLQGVATVSGIVRAEHGLEGLMRAAFPPGSITGAPKVRAMQIIEELERNAEGGAARGPYCGCIGFVSDSGRAEFSVAIRTAVLTPAQQQAGPQRAQSGHGGTEANAGGVEEICYAARGERSGGSGSAAGDMGAGTWNVRYGIGAGIVADSDPASEWRETLIKARIWRGIADIQEE